MKSKLKHLNLGITVILEQVEKVNLNSSAEFSGVTLMSGEEVLGECEFLAFVGSEINTDLLKQLGVERLENHHIVADSRSKETNIARAINHCDGGRVPKRLFGYINAYLDNDGSRADPSFFILIKIPLYFFMIKQS
jgi:hypothetical protein